MDPSSSRSSDDVFGAQPDQTHPVRPRIYSPETSNPTRRRPYSAEGPNTHTYVHINPPLRRGSPLNPQRALSQDRRRLNSNDNLNPPSELPFRPRRSPLLVPMDDQLTPNLRNIPELDSGVNELNAFSDEYDLSHEDPRILQDVQRALRIKAKREAKNKATQSAPDHQTSPKVAPYPRLVSPSTPPHSGKATASIGSDVDFSPSTRRPPIQTLQHPVPSSLDNGLTLDWGPSTVIDEKSDRKWSLSVRRKDKLPPLELMQDQQEKNHRERLSKLRASASSQTLRKAAMTSDQLQRRYNVFEEMQANSKTLNLAEISLWYGSRDETARWELERVEPLTWLKHLPRRKQLLPRRHLSARIIEEFITAQTAPQQPQSQSHYMETIQEDQSMLNSSHPLTHQQSPEHMRVPFDGKLRSPRSSFDVDSRSADSALSSIISGSSNHIIYPTPSNQQYASPRARNLSPWDYSGSGPEESARIPATVETSPEQLSRRTQSSPDSKNVQKKTVISLSDRLPKLVLPVSEEEEEGETNDDHNGRPSPSPGVSSRPHLGLLGGNSRSLSSPLSRHPSVPPPPVEDPQKEIETEEALKREYEQKASLLKDMTLHNQRIRQLLNRISFSVKEYDTTQRNAMDVLGKQYHPLPSELVESFGHDPAAVTGATRRLKGWRAVEDIYHRLVKQRKVFCAFITLESRRNSDHGSILDDKVTSLIRSLSVLEERKAELATRSQDVERILESVQSTYKDVKADYDKTVPLTSTLYPELSRAVALEESYKDQYQQIWEFGMDALTLLLDTVTPFWRNYGKIIGEDIRDFLIIPLYRNEFTGEAKRYTINVLPRRSSRHWLGLNIFFLASILLMYFQARFAFLFTMHSRLKWIPFEGMRYTALPFFWIGIFMQWCAVLFECGVVFMELAVIAWWMGWSVNLLT